MSTCDKCKHYLPGDNWPAQCALMGDSNDFKKLLPDRAYGYDYEGYSAGVYVGPKFGCIHWTKKDMKTISHLYTHGQIEIDCELEYDSGQRATEIDPAYAPEAYLISAKVGGVDILPLLSIDLMAQIEEAAACSQD